jgi:SAM-dependent methyltransferase
MGKCTLCGSDKILPLIDFGNQPIAHNYLTNPLQDEYTYPFELRYCNVCGMIFIENPIPADVLYKDYFTLSSWKHQPHILRLIQMIEETGISKTARILEVGSNDGRFLAELKERGYQNLVGIEPADDAQKAAKARGVETIPDFFNEKSAHIFKERYGSCDIFISRQMLEHVGDLQEFMKCMKSVMSPGGFVVVEVPDFSGNLDNLDYTVWEEHTNYFTFDNLAMLMSSSGIEIIHSETTIFSGETLTIIGRYTGSLLRCTSGDFIEGLRAKICTYRDQWAPFRTAFVEYLRCHKENGGSIAIYGAGARLCSLVNFTGTGPYIECVVDDQAEKQGLCLPGSKLQIVPSSALNKRAIDLCLLAVNTECEEMVMAKHSEYLDRGGVFVSVLPPSDRLPGFWKSLIDKAYDC